MQRRADAKNRRGGGILLQGGDGREEAMAGRSKVVPREEPKKKKEDYYIGEQGVTRKRELDIFGRDERERKPRPNPARGNQKLIGGKRKAVGPPDADYEQVRRRPPPKPEGRLKARSVRFTGVREVAIPAVPGANRKPPRAASVQSGAPLPPPRKGGNTKKKK